MPERRESLYYKISKEGLKFLAAEVGRKIETAPPGVITKLPPGIRIEIAKILGYKRKN